MDELIIPEEMAHIPFEPPIATHNPQKNHHPPARTLCKMAHALLPQKQLTAESRTVFTPLQTHHKSLTICHSRFRAGPQVADMQETSVHLHFQCRYARSICSHAISMTLSQNIYSYDVMDMAIELDNIFAVCSVKAR